ncbi:alpha-glucuronidase family glycosyl hydrolase, partial [Sphingomonas sp. BK580]|uniref:alpha-glucuronidase family glycosyl hydrolase n=1 Tax=Sphingomonas sp. BK580 TaxID=2586972 RepID=UPI0018236C01
MDRGGSFRVVATALALLLAGTAPARAEDGYRLWLRADAPAGSSARVTLRGDGATLRLAADELSRSLPAAAGDVTLALAGDPQVAALRLPTAALGDEGYLVRRVRLGGRDTLLVTGNGERGLLYGSFALLRHLATGGSAATVALASAPRVKLRVLNHWDNLDGSVERGYAGQSLWDWWTL